MIHVKKKLIRTVIMIYYCARVLYAVFLLEKCAVQKKIYFDVLVISRVCFVFEKSRFFAHE